MHNVNVNGKRDYSSMNNEASNQSPTKRTKTSEDVETNFCTKFSRNHIENSNAVIYCRVSTKNQTFGTSLESQKLFCQEYCSKNNLNVKSIINETNSAKSMDKQEELNNFLDFNEDINLVVYEPSRLSRNLKDFVQFMDQCKEHNITIHFVQDELVSSNNYDFTPLHI